MNELTALDILPAMASQAPCAQRYPVLYRRWLLRRALGAVFFPRPRGKFARVLYLHDITPIPQA